jgi:hypothetical protein
MESEKMMQFLTSPVPMWLPIALAIAVPLIALIGLFSIKEPIHEDPPHP